MPNQIQQKPATSLKTLLYLTGKAPAGRKKNIQKPKKQHKLSAF
ncbi:hypothetical protein BMETH_2748_0 [methanotrophic bacterial endosymbiont of Bathymodiolus sp.]|nr:hypothetical protein BMETH_2748_0 [methanotrophic bacterial endosymbiont of Bathymodiolus sp.]